MAWIESHQTLARHPKVIRLSSLLRIHKAQAIGHLHLLWWWTLDYAPTGDLSVFASCELGSAAEWPGDAEKFRRAMVESKLLDESGMIHDWHEYAGKLVEQREADRLRKRVQRTSGGHPADIQRLSGVPNPTYPTQPNPTQEGAVADAPVCEVPKPKKPKPPETIPEGFNRFWSLYPGPRKADKGLCLKRWREFGCEQVSEAVLSGLNAWRASHDWTKDGGQYVCQPLRWLRNRRWESPPERPKPPTGDKFFREDR